jgi:hypothetical protein
MIFLSYSWQYAGSARWLDDQLRRQGHPVWIDFRDLNTQEDLHVEIAKAVKRCSLFLMVRRADFRPTPWMEIERQIATRYQKPIVQHVLHEGGRPLRLLPHEPADFTYKPNATGILQPYQS